jgi:hypothetical protein
VRSGAQPPIGSTWQLGSVFEPQPPVDSSPPFQGERDEESIVNAIRKEIATAQKGIRRMALIALTVLYINPLREPPRARRDGRATYRPPSGDARCARPEQPGHGVPDQLKEIAHRRNYRPIRRRSTAVLGFRQVQWSKY